MRLAEVDKIADEYQHTNEVVQSLCQELYVLNDIIARMASDLADLIRENEELRRPPRTVIALGMGERP